jgi:hypothetical protein
VNFVMRGVDGMISDEARSARERLLEYIGKTGIGANDCLPASCKNEAGYPQDGLMVLILHSTAYNIFVTEEKELEPLSTGIRCSN